MIAALLAFPTGLLHTRMAQRTSLLLYSSAIMGSRWTEKRMWLACRLESGQRQHQLVTVSCAWLSDFWVSCKTLHRHSKLKFSKETEGSVSVCRYDSTRGWREDGPLLKSFSSMRSSWQTDGHMPLYSLPPWCVRFTHFDLKGSLKQYSTQKIQKYIEGEWLTDDGTVVGLWGGRRRTSSNRKNRFV